MSLLSRLLRRTAAKPQPLATPDEVRERLADMVIEPEEAKPAVLTRRQIERLRQLQPFRELYDASQASLAHSDRVRREIARNNSRAA